MTMISHGHGSRLKYSHATKFLTKSKHYIFLSFLISNKITGGRSYSPTSKITSTPSSPTYYYYTCRHTFEEKLIEELHLPALKNSGEINKNIWGVNKNSVVDVGDDTSLVLRKASSPFPGLVKAEYYEEPVASSNKPDMDEATITTTPPPDPIYALQVLPNSVSVNGKTIRELSTGIISILGLDKVQLQQPSSLAQELIAAPKGSLTVHALVPDMFKGSPKPKMIRRAHSIADDVISKLQKVFPCSRHRSGSSGTKMKWILQLLLISPDEVIVSLSPVHFTASSNAFSQMSWPCATITSGLANVEEECLSLSISSSLQEEGLHKFDDVTTPSSAYRKLLEAFSCIGSIPNPNSSSNLAVDLGASPGGWVSMLYKLGYTVIAVDRSELDRSLMSKTNDIVFQSSDAFSYDPSSSTDSTTLLMVSDIISFPNRIIELLETWCQNRWTHYLIVTMKFKDTNNHNDSSSDDDATSTSNWDNICRAIQVVEEYGYVCRVKHFFNNKNEVMFMIAKKNDDDDVGALSSIDYLRFIPQNQFPIMLPKTK